ncbi:MAG: tRNA (adenosine(37)-N6)-dimethylallyltransferase MiaA [Limibacillus sp.]
MAEAADKRGLPLVVVVAGPTASGKSALALDLAEAFGGTVINADALQLYRDLRVLSARPSPEEEARAPHRLYGLLPGEEAASAGRWRALALAALEESLAEGRLPILCGGSGLYIKALKEGLAPVPQVPKETRDAAEALFAMIGGPAMKERLGERDPETAEGVRSSDRQRLVRAWSVLEATGRGLAAWRREPGDGGAPYRFFDILITPPREEVREACGRRFAAMLEAGALEEVRALLDKGLPPDAPVLKAIGVPKPSAYLRGALTLEEAKAEAEAATRRYAKRQMTWLRTQAGLPDLGLQQAVSQEADSKENEGCVIETQYSESHRQKIFSKIRESLLTLLKPAD